MTTKLISKDMMEGISGCVCYLSGFHLKAFFAGCRTFFFLVIVSLTVVGQSVKHPTPQDIRESVNDTSKSDKYTIINYSISGIRKPGAYLGRHEGGPPDPKVTEKNNKASIDRLDEDIRNEPTHPVLYENRGKSYLELYTVTEDVSDRAVYAEKALMDLNKSIEINPEYWQSFELRARLLKLVDFFKYFDLIVSDQLEAIRILPKYLVENPGTTNEYRSRVNQLYATISYQYMNRAELLTSHPDLFSEVRRRYKEYTNYSYLNDFNLALEYTNKDAANPLNAWSVVNFSISRGDAAYRLGEFDIALDSYSSANDYWNEKSNLACNASPNECEREKKYRDSILRMKFVRVYMKLQKWETALNYMNPYLEHFPNTLCPGRFWFDPGSTVNLERMSWLWLIPSQQEPNYPIRQSAVTKPS